METLKIEDVMGTIDALLAAGKKPAMWERLTHLTGDALMLKQMEVLENVAQGLLEYANNNGIGKQLWEEATQEATLMTDYEWRYIHQGLMNAAIKTVRERHKAEVKAPSFEDLGEIVNSNNGGYNNVLTTANKSNMFAGWIKRHLAAHVPPSPGGWNSSEKQMEYMGERLGVDVKTNGNNRVAIRMFLEDYNNKRNGRPYIPTKVSVKDKEVILVYD